MKKEVNMLYFGKERHNKPVVTLLKEYCNKKSGKVSEARRELQRRFEHLDWSQQKKIMMVHLQACASDRNWAYTQLLSFWDESFTPMIEELWQTYHEERCSWIIVKHFPENFLKNHIKELSQGRNYFFICRRLGSDESFPIDASRLQPLDYLALMADLGRTISTATAMELLFTIAKKECQTRRFFIIGRRWFEPRLTKPSPLSLNSLSRAYYYLQEMTGCDEARKQFTAWCDRISDELQHSEEFISLLQQPLCDDDFNQKAYHLLLKRIALNLPEKIRNAKLFEMTENNNVLEKLVDRFDLEEDVTPTPPPPIFQGTPSF